MSDEILKMLARFADHFTGLFGYRLISDWRLKRYEMTEHLKSIFEMLKINHVLDVGANTGQYRDFLRAAVGYKGRIVSFEPVHANVKDLEARARRDSEWKIEPYALGASNEIRKINVMRRNTFSSFLSPVNQPPTRIRGLNVTDHLEEVQIQTLDTVYPRVIEGLASPKTYLKMDTQGFDMEVVRGAKTILDSIAALQTEVSVQAIYEGTQDFLHVISELRSLGFEVSGLYPVTRDEFQQVIEFDCVMVKRAGPH